MLNMYKKILQNKNKTLQNIDVENGVALWHNVKRGRNNSRSFHPKNTDILTYKKATGFEALIGYLYLNDKDRLNEILGYVEVI